VVQHNAEQVQTGSNHHEGDTVSQNEGAFRGGRRVLVAALVLAGAVGCASNEVRVRTALAPDANLNTERTFRFLPMTVTHPVGNVAQEGNPMLENSITGREVRQDIARELQQRGYAHVPRDSASDLTIAYYIGSKNHLEVTDYNYGYPFWGWRGWRWGAGWGAWPDRQVTEYQEGTVIIDLLDGSGKKLLWRGVGKSEVPDDPQDYAKALNRSVSAILREYPGHAAA
jgi:hypothetical protein